MKRLPDNSVDAIVTDPPAAIGFMNTKWDSDKGGRKQWCAYMEERFAEALRVCKPGAHALVWALPRTSHWTATALEQEPAFVAIAKARVAAVTAKAEPSLSDRVEWLETQVKATAAKVRKLEKSAGQLSLFDIAG